MSTYYRSLNPITFDEVFDGRMARFGVREHVEPGGTSDTDRCLTDGRNYLWAYATEDGFLGDIARYGGGGAATYDIPMGAPNAPGKILEAIAEAFDTEIVSEYEPQYWGFETEEEMDARHHEIHQEHRQEFYEEILRYLRGEPNDIRKGTIGARRAEIAKELISQTPDLVEDKDRLLNEVERIDEERHVLKVTLTQEDLDLARLCAAHEDDLPQA
jgi:hypothetical protein